MIPSAVQASATLPQTIPTRFLAAPNPPPPDDNASYKAKEQALKLKKEKFDQAVAAMETHMGINSANELYLDVTTAAEVGIDEESFTALKRAMEHTNALLRSGKVKLSDVHFSTKGPKEADNSTVTAASCAGINAAYMYWWGYRFYMNECLTQQIEGLLWMGAGAATICGVLAGVFAQVEVTVICGLSAALMGIGAGYIQYVDGGGGNQGIIVDYNWFYNDITWIGNQ